MTKTPHHLAESVLSGGRDASTGLNSKVLTTRGRCLKPSDEETALY